MTLGQHSVLCINFFQDTHVLPTLIKSLTFIVTTVGILRRVPSMESVATINRRVIVTTENTVGLSLGLVVLTMARAHKLIYLSFGPQTDM